jgi:DNA-binding MarR family transcriptional regulator
MTVVIDASRLEKKRKEAIRARTVRDRHQYFQSVAQTRYVLRKVFRLIEERAKVAGLDPLEHQALIQIYGSKQMKLRVKEVAERLDIAPAFASSILKSLEKRKLVVRLASDRDQRVTYVVVTTRGKELLHRIDEQVHLHVDFFTQQLPQDVREAAISIMMFYIGISLATRQAAKSNTGG